MNSLNPGARHLTQRNTQTHTPYVEMDDFLSLFFLPPFLRARNLTRVYVRLRYTLKLQAEKC
jgi:hypothetical protein